MWSSVLLFVTPIYFSVLKGLFLNISSEVLPPSIDYTGVVYSLQELNTLEKAAKFLLPIKFRYLLADVIKPNDSSSDDQFLMLWLKKQNFDLDSANQKFRKVLQWRKQNNMDSIVTEKIVQSAPDLCWVDGIAKDGSPIISMRLGGLDVRRMILAGQGNNMIRRTYQCLEVAMIKSIEMTNSTGKIISQAILIADAEGFNQFQHACLWCMQLGFRYLRECDEFWPDALKLLVIVNAPPLVKPVMEVMLPLLDPSRRTGIKLFGPDKKKWSSFLQEIVSPDQLSVRFGGKRLRRT